MNGWYYDRQLNDPLTSISLHPNKELDKETGEWVAIGFDENGNKRGDGEQFKRDTGYVGQGYRLKPIAKAILSEDFTVSIANNWSNVNGGDAITGIWGGLRTIAPYIPMIEPALDSIISTSKKDNTSQPVTTKFKDAIGALAGKSKNLIDKINPHLNEQLIVQGTRFAYYAGSGTAFGNLGMKFTLFPMFEDGVFKSVVEQAKDILDYSNGKYREDDLSMIKAIAGIWATTFYDTAEKVTEFMNENSGKFDDWANKLREGRKNDKIQEKVTQVTGEFMDLLNRTGNKATNIADDISRLITDRGLIGWQSAPGGYVPSYRDINEAIEGTLKLRIGTHYSISSLLCQDATLNFSKVMVKDPFTGNISPLYCDVALTLTPASKFANQRLEEFIGAKNSKNPYYNTIAKDLRNRLDSEKELIKKNYDL